jgi:predicted transcriptional regulator
MTNNDTVLASNVKEVTSTSLPTVEPRHMTKEAMQKDFDYMMAQKMTQALLENGLITNDEFDKITAKNKERFSPFMAELMH